MAENTILSKLDGLEARYQEVSTLITDPAVIADQQRFIKLTKEYKDLEDIDKLRKRYIDCLDAIAEAKDILMNESDPDMKEMAREQLAENEEKQPSIEEEIKIALIPKDPEDAKNVQMEIRAGTGGDEACLFAGDLFKMYKAFCDQKGWSLSVTDISEGAVGGYKEIDFAVRGTDVYGVLKYESGVHRVQRVPVTESNGRMQTSAATVAVLPEVEEVDVELNPADVEMQVFRSSGAGGQHVNKTSSAVRLIHKPTGTVVECQQERSQFQNRDKAMRILASKLYEAEQEKRDAAEAAERKSQVGSGDRSERIRTYNFPQGRVTDHRIGLTLYKIDAIMDGDLDELIDALVTADQAERLKNGAGADQ